MMSQQTGSNPSVQIKNARNISIFGIVLIITGAITFVCGISIYATLRIIRVPINQHGASVLASIWIIITGILCVLMRWKSRSLSYVGICNVFLVITSGIAFVATATSIVGLSKYADCETKFGVFNIQCFKRYEYGLAVYAILLVLHLAQMVISLTATVYGFKIQNCCITNREQQTNVETFQAAPQPTIPQNYTVSQQQYQPYQPQQDQIFVTSSSGQQFKLIPATQYAQQTAIVSPVSTTRATPSAPPPYVQ